MVGPVMPLRQRRKEFRKRYLQEQDDRWKRFKARQNGDSSEDIHFEIMGAVTKPFLIDMKTFTGTEEELATATERLYSSCCLDLDPDSQYPTSMQQDFGKDFILNARGIYYRPALLDASLGANRKVWSPTLSKSGVWEVPGIPDRYSRARTLAAHSRNNGEWVKSEYAWEADAWADVFAPMRDDPSLVVDKRDYVTILSEVDEIKYELTGKSTPVKRTPDATFGLGTYTDRNTTSPGWVNDLHRSRLERLLLHPKYGLCADPKRGESSMAFPFMVYEAKGWGGDCRVAKRQACTAAACYLDMLDELVRRPGPAGSSRPYQTKTSHQYQVFALTSFGAYWHLLVGYRRPRLEGEHAGTEGLSENVYMFHRIWSGHVTNEETAWELLWILDQIQVWSTTEYRSFVLDHLRPWHALCDENFLLEWDSSYDLGNSRKRKRDHGNVEELTLPSWVDQFPDMRSKIQTRARDCLNDAIRESNAIKGKSPQRDNGKDAITCAQCEEHPVFGSSSAFIHHLRTEHGPMEESTIANLRWIFQEHDMDRGIEKRLEYGILPSGRLDPANPRSYVKTSKGMEKRIRLPDKADEGVPRNLSVL